MEEARELRYCPMDETRHRLVCVSVIGPVLFLLAQSGCHGQPEDHYMEMAHKMSGATPGATKEEIEQCKLKFDRISEGDTNAIPALIYLMGIPDWEAFAEYWAMRVGKKAIPALMSALDTLDGEKKARVVIVLGDIAGADIQVQNRLVQLLSDKDDNVAIHSQRALRHTGVKKQVSDEVYRRILKDGEGRCLSTCIKEMYLNKRFALMEEGLINTVRSVDLDRLLCYWMIVSLSEVKRSKNVRAAMMELKSNQEQNKDPESLKTFKRIWEEYEPYLEEKTEETK